MVRLSPARHRHHPVPLLAIAMARLVAVSIAAPVVGDRIRTGLPIWAGSAKSALSVLISAVTWNVIDSRGRALPPLPISPLPVPTIRFAPISVLPYLLIGSTRPVSDPVIPMEA